MECPSPRCSAVWCGTGVEALDVSAQSTNGWTASGFVEAEPVSIAPEIAGRIAELPFDEGDSVQAGEMLLRLEDDLPSAQVDLARGKLEESLANLAQAKAGARQETIDRVTAQLALAQAMRDGAQQAWIDAQAIRNNPQALDVQAASARAQVAVARSKLDAALIQRDLAEQSWKDYGEGVDKLAGIPQAYRPHMPTDFYLIPYQWEQAQTGANAAQAAYDGARSALDHLLAQRSNPQEAVAQVDAAHARYQAAVAAVAQAQATLDGVKADATQEQIAAAQAQVDLAQAALEAARLQLAKATVHAPISAVVVARSAQVGEMAAPGIAALTLADLDDVTLTIYVPGQRVRPDRAGPADGGARRCICRSRISGAVSHISDQAEYTPRSVRVPEERAMLVYAVKIKIANPDHVLKPGMQAEARGK